MKIDSTFLRSKVARRIFFLFVVSALLPILALSTVSLFWVNRQLEDQSYQRLRKATRTQADNLRERCAFLSGELRLAASGLEGLGTKEPSLAREWIDDAVFERLILVTETGEAISLFGGLDGLPALGDDERSYLENPVSIVIWRRLPDSRSRVFMVRKVDPKAAGDALLWAELNPGYLWWGPAREHNLPFGTEMMMLEETGGLLFSSLPGPVSLPERVTLDTRITQIESGGAPTGTHIGQFEWRHKDKDYFGRFFTIPPVIQSHIDVPHAFISPSVRIVLAESKLTPTWAGLPFALFFSLVVLLSLWVVLLLSTSLIRKNLTPLERLQEGTRRIAERQFDARVEVTSGDEFEELADSFNNMAQRLGRQFNALTTLNEIVEAVLAALDREGTVATVLETLGEFLPCDHLCITLLEDDPVGRGLTYSRRDGSAGATGKARVQLTPGEIDSLQKHPRHLSTTIDGKPPSYLQPLGQAGLRSLTAFPVFVQDRLAGIITLAFQDRSDLDREDLRQGRQVADQVAVALANTQLIADLEQLNWGTLTALARAIDEKSHWTMGHSERVTALAMDIARVLGLSEEELEMLHRGGLLHDIGKIGVTAAILDKPGRLTPEETRTMQEHVNIGARILEPIPSLTNVIGMVRQHHEWFNGEGYPDGATGEEIDRFARILAVADSYDALRSERPYRGAVPHEEVMEYVSSRAGIQFDPEVVEAFLKHMGKDEQIAQPQSVA
jgi:putative nucleotidyltransferase with HDIG domain